jgi:hypothetical protein
MKTHDLVVARQLPIIQQIIQDETWLESERRGYPVSSTDPVVRENVCAVVLRIGQQLRKSLSGGESGPVLGVPANGVRAQCADEAVTAPGEDVRSSADRPLAT